MVTRVSDLSLEELRSFIREVVIETIEEFSTDPDEGLELREDFKIRLQHSLETVEAGGETIPIEVVAADLGLEW